ncbi:hypothetical protein [Stenotrophomonas maltophilia]|uniref:hypothetical protein n=1 Tax=Stenotrophomonas maltophilia TaxID=40324 RepID=UPI000DB4DCD6|nr:hypothetical protein [Stenotrophomonas maltophilia]PZT11486.1 hypothetical protein A7X91_06685 [Stenotrophomonas maltophilia]
MKWITALDLDQWADSLPARVDFPGMVGDLIRASLTSISDFRFPRGDKGQVRGFDGVLDAESNCAFVPDGESVWEFGVTEGGAVKANGDYKKRTEELDVEARKRTTFVFVSPRTWDSSKGNKREDWVEEKRALNEWRDVLYIDGSMLEDWLTDCPAVAARYAKNHLKKMPLIGAQSSIDFWEEFSTKFAPELADKVLLAGREDQAKQLIQQLSDGPGKLLYAADAPDEVVAFAIAAIRNADPALRLFIEAKTLVVDSEDAVRQLVHRRGLVFLLRGHARNLAGLLMQAGPTVVSAGADERRPDHVKLNRPSSSQLADAFVAMNFTQKEGYDLARRCGRSLAVLARLRPSGNATKPEWLESAEPLIPAMLAGAWHAPTKPDTDVLRALAQADDYENVEAPLRRLARLQDPPVDKVGDVWSMRASVDAFVHLGYLLGPKHLERFKEAVIAVFSQIIPPPEAHEVFRPKDEREAIHSGWLKDGLMTTLLHMAVLHEQADFTVTGSTPTEYVNGIVRELPGLSKDHRLLAALQDQLVLLAEAAPVPFLEALERLLEGDASGIKHIFDEFEGFITPRAYHYGVLWALEVIAWDPNLLLRASMCLARLAAVDPGGSDSNRPINSLRAIFLSWSPNSYANAAQRTGVLTHVVDSVPEIAWSLLTNLLPKPHDSSSPTQRPKFREYGDGKPEILTYGLVWESQAAVIRLALARAGHDSSRWAMLISAFHQFPESVFPEAIETLRAELNASHEGTFQIWNQLRKEVNRHKRFAGTDWALRDQPLVELDELVSSHAPKSPVLLASWLFDDWMPDVPGNDVGADDPMASIEAARAKAIAEVYEGGGVDAIVELVGMVQLPQHVAYAVRALKLGKEELMGLLQATLKARKTLVGFADVVLGEVVGRFGADGEDSLRAMLQSSDIDPACTARLLMALPEGEITWAYVATFGEPVEDAYWHGKHSYFINGGVGELLEGIDNYRKRGRFIAALDAASTRLKDIPTVLLVELLRSAIPEINSTGSMRGNRHYVLGQSFDELRLRRDVSMDDIAQLEFLYLPMFRIREKSLVLHHMLVEQPGLFVDVVAAVYKPEHGEAEPLDEDARHLAMSAYELLEGLQSLPGQAGDRIDGERLLGWCMEVRELAKNQDRLSVAEQRIGQVLARAPADPEDGVWPHEVVRVAIEKMASDNLERGLSLARVNQRGVYSKSMGEGGAQERELAAECFRWADAVPKYPRTSAMLRRIGENWMVYAERADIEAAEEALKW